MLAELTDQDWDFRAIWQPHRAAELIVACWYELPRESRLVMTAVEKWLRLEKSHAEMFQKAKDQNIELNEVHRACLYLVQGVHWKRLLLEQHEPGYEPDWPDPLRQSVERDNPAAVKLLSRLSNKYLEVVFSEYDMQLLEDLIVTYGGIGAPRLRFLASHLVQDTPWLKIPKQDRDSALAHVFKSNSEVPQDAHGLTFFRPTPPIECIDEMQELVRLRKADPRKYLGEVDFEFRFRVRYNPFTDRAIRESWAQLGERLVINRRPKEWKNRAKAIGRRRSGSWCGQL
jgi:hypothetical protein